MAIPTLEISWVSNKGCMQRSEFTYVGYMHCSSSLKNLQTLHEWIIFWQTENTKCTKM